MGLTITVHPQPSGKVTLPYPSDMAISNRSSGLVQPCNLRGTGDDFTPKIGQTPRFARDRGIHAIHQLIRFVVTYYIMTDLPLRATSMRWPDLMSALDQQSGVDAIASDTP